MHSQHDADCLYLTSSLKKIFYERECTDESPLFGGHPIIIFLFRENAFQILSKMLTSWKEEESNCVCVL